VSIDPTLGREHVTPDKHAVILGILLLKKTTLQNVLEHGKKDLGLLWFYRVPEV